MPSARANSSASTPSASSSTPASTNEKSPSVLTIRSNAPTAATRCSKFRSRAARTIRRGRSRIVERAAAREAGLGLVPVADGVLAVLPAQVHLASVADRGEVEQAAVEVAQHDLELAQLHHGVAQLDEALGDGAAGRAAAVRRAGLGQRLARLAVAQAVACRPHLGDQLHDAREQLRCFLERVVALVDHAAAPAPARMRRSSSRASASDTVRSCPWKARCQCPAGHFPTCSSPPASSTAGTNSSSASTTSGSVAKRDSQRSALQGFPREIFSRSSYGSQVALTMAPKYWMTVE